MAAPNSEAFQAAPDGCWAPSNMSVLTRRPWRDSGLELTCRSMSLLCRCQGQCIPGGRGQGQAEGGCVDANVNQGRMLVGNMWVWSGNVALFCCGASWESIIHSTVVFA